MENEDSKIEITPPSPSNDPTEETGPSYEQVTEPTIEGTSGEEEQPSMGMFSNESISILSPDEMQQVGNPAQEEPTIETPVEAEEKVKETRKASISAEKKAAIYKALAEEFSEAGLLPADVNLEEFDGTLDGLKELVGKKEANFMEKYQESYASNFTGAKKRFLEIEDAFTNESEAMQVAQDLEFFNTVNEYQVSEDENVAKALYGKLLSSRGFTQEQITEAIEDADALGKLTDKAMEALPILRQGAEAYVHRSREQKEAMQRQQIEQAKQTFDDMLNSIDEREHMIKDMPFNKTHKEKIKERLSKAVYTDENGRNYTSIGHKQLSNPREFEILMAYYDELGLFDIDAKTGKFKPNLSKLRKTVTTQSSKKIDDIITDEDVRLSNGSYSGSAPLEGHERTESILSLLSRGYDK
jgi:hypothetical protein